MSLCQPLICAQKLCLVLCYVPDNVICHEYDVLKLYIKIVKFHHVCITNHIQSYTWFVGLLFSLWVVGINKVCAIFLLEIASL